MAEPSKIVLELRVARAQTFHMILNELGPHEFLTTLKVVFEDMVRECEADAISLKGLQDGHGTRADDKECEAQWWKAISAGLDTCLFSAKMLKELEKTP